ncbi:3-phosphoshikimate 1-carboxyvinyltransferase [Paenibacillus herberti]|uniref:3-phosphoshikimate 1-carboxyvinyltransferase n=1 Tax=Paenibacillus herberti TaxID=1619309 RepID=A0A229P0W8_9BACL|nr:3-phosphoshikimate 1-carboxyvinyltransferase [Paenibacillus herberti]OXM15896.1 3-phosphoshikimate 1-carboxyvinyltransferase [Paenibacillus herberti]
MESVQSKASQSVTFDISVRSKPGGQSFLFDSVPGDKSVSQRGIILNAIGEGRGVVHNVLRSRDIESCVAILGQLGVECIWDGDDLAVSGRGLRGLKPPEFELDIGNTATSARLLLSVLAGHPFRVELAGNRLLSTRPMEWVVDPLIRMGARIDYLGNPGRLPLTIEGRAPLLPLDVEATVASAQEKSAMLFAALYAEGTSHYRQLCQSRDHTERLLRYFGIAIKTEENVTSIQGTSSFACLDVWVPGDISSAAFMLAAYVIRNDEQRGELAIRNVGVNPTRLGFFRALRAMGLELELSGEHDLPSGEPQADLHCSPRSSLKSVLVEGDEEVQSLIDEIPLLAAICALAEGTSVIRNCRELKDKDTNRIETTARMLAAFGIQVDYNEDEMVIHGEQRPSAAVVDSCGDHRIAMTAAVLASSLDEPSIIKNCGCIAVSYPNFLADLAQFAEIELLD